MENCYDNNRLVPITKVVSAAIADSREDGSKAGLQHLYLHWASRGFKKIAKEVLRMPITKALLHFNRTTGTASLPVDFEQEVFVGIIDCDGKKIPIRSRTDLHDEKAVNEIECNDRCEKCGQDKSLCKDLELSESVTSVIINGETYEQVVSKKMYPSGDVYIETRMPVYNEDNDEVEYITNKEFVRTLSLKPCGCIEETEENIEAVKCISYDTYCCYLSPCENVIDKMSYQIFEDSGYIKIINAGYRVDKVYLEYRGNLVKRGGQFYVPEVCFETLVNWIIYKSVENRKSIQERQWALENYKRERKNMEKLIGSTLTLQNILQAAISVPKFDYLLPLQSDCCKSYSEYKPTSSIVSSQSSSSVVTQEQPVQSPVFTPFSIAVIAGNGSGSPVVGVNYYQNDKLKNAIGINGIIVNNNNESELAGSYVLDTVEGKITRFQPDGETPNNWQLGDTLVIPVFFKLI